VEVTVSIAWQGRFCGNYNNDASDYFATPAGELVAIQQMNLGNWQYDRLWFTY